jgi:cytochrome b561
MEAAAGGRVSSAIFWIFLSVCLGSLACGWAAVHVSLDEARQGYFRELHVSLGLAGAIIIVFQLLVTIASLSFGRRRGPSGRPRVVSFLLRQLAYLSFLALLVTGAGAAAFSGERILFFGIALPYVNGADQPTSEALQSAHPAAAYTLAGGIASNLIAAAIRRFFPKPEQSSLPTPTVFDSSIQSVVAGRLAQSFRFFGGVVFWVQLLLGLLSVPLLVFSYAGHTVSPSHRGYGDPIFWASVGLSLLFVSVISVRYYLKIAKVMRVAPERYLGRPAQGAFWFFAPMGFISIFGALASFAGVGLSVALLIGKTVSQPPGIAITDPSKIVRALDIFLLLVNVDLLLAHFVGVGITAWLSISALKAHHQYSLGSNGAQSGPPRTASA